MFTLREDCVELFDEALALGVLNRFDAGEERLLLSFGEGVERELGLKTVVEDEVFAGGAEDVEGGGGHGRRLPAERLDGKSFVCVLFGGVTTCCQWGDWRGWEGVFYGTGKVDGSWFVTRIGKHGSKPRL